MEAMIRSFDGTSLYMKKETRADDRAVAVIVHGLAEHQGRYDHVAEALHTANIGTYRFDHRGHGRSKGERTYLSDFNELLDDTNVFVNMAIEENPDLPVFLIGHSMGGFTVTGYGLKYPDKRIAGIITSDPVLPDGSSSGENTFPPGTDPHERVSNSLSSGVCSVPEVVDTYLKDPLNMMTIAKGLFMEIETGKQWIGEHLHEFRFPVLMLHGEKDPLIPAAVTYHFFETAASADKQMKIYGGLFHEIFNEYCKDEVIADAVRWILKRSGR